MEGEGREEGGRRGGSGRIKVRPTLVYASAGCDLYINRLIN